jgi:hypothetical protein
MGKPRHCNNYSSSSSDSDSSTYDEKYSNSDKKKHCHRSSDSSLSSSEKRINHKVHHVEKHLEKKDKELERKDRYFARKIRKLERRYCKIYKKVKWNLRREKCLMVNGCDAYGAFSNSVAQTIMPNDPIVFAKNDGSLNMDFAGAELYIKRDGVYKYCFTGQFNEGSLLQLFINGNPIDYTIVGSNSGANIVSMQQLLYLQVGDVVTIRNIHSSSIATATGFDTLSQNVDFTLFKIAPLPEPCCIPPPICEKIEWTSECTSDNKECMPHTPPMPTKGDGKQEKTDAKADKNDAKVFENKYDAKQDKTFIAPKQTQAVAKNTLKFNRNN